MSARAIAGAAVAVVAAGSATIALAAVMSVGATRVGSGSTPVLPCDANGFAESYTTSGGVVTQVTISGIADPGCEGGTLRLTLIAASGASIASGGPTVIPTDPDTVDNTVTVPASPQPTSSQVAGIRVSVTGP